MPCSVPGIPQRLHRNGRGTNDDFSKDEKVYIRIQPDNFYTEDIGGQQSQKVRISAFTTSLQSFNRDIYCDQATDVLFNINAESNEDHFLNWGVISLEKESLQELSFEHPELQQVFRIGLTHKVEECMYPHGEITIYNETDSKRVNVSINSKKLKTLIKGAYLDKLQIEKSANED